MKRVSLLYIIAPCLFLLLLSGCNFQIAGVKNFLDEWTVRYCKAGKIGAVNSVVFTPLYCPATYSTGGLTGRGRWGEAQPGYEGGTALVVFSEPGNSDALYDFSGAPAGIDIPTLYRGAANNLFASALNRILKDRGAKYKRVYFIEGGPGMSVSFFDTISLAAKNHDRVDLYIGVHGNYGTLEGSADFGENIFQYKLSNSPYAVSSVNNTYWIASDRISWEERHKVTAIFNTACYAKTGDSITLSVTDMLTLFFPNSVTYGAVDLNWGPVHRDLMAFDQYLKGSTFSNALLLGNKSLTNNNYTGVVRPDTLSIGYLTDKICAVTSLLCKDVDQAIPTVPVPSGGLTGSQGLLQKGISGDYNITITSAPPPPAPPKPTRVTITPNAKSIGYPLPAQVTLVATAYDATNTVVPNSTFTWVSSNPFTCPVNSSGVVSIAKTFTAPCVISATAAGITGNSTITFVPQPLTSIVVTPATSQLYGVLPQSVQLTAVATYAGGSNGVPIRWTSLSSECSVSPTGLVTVNQPLTNRCYIYADTTVQPSVYAYGYVYHSLNPPTPTPTPTPTLSIRVVISPTSPTVTDPFPSTTQLTAKVYDSNNNVVNTPVTWTSNNPTQCQVSNTGLVQAQSSIATTTYCNIAAAAGIETAAVYVNYAPQPVTSVVVTPNQATVTGALPATRQLQATTYFSGGVSAVPVMWSSTGNNCFVDRNGLVTLVAGATSCVVNAITAYGNAVSGSATITYSSAVPLPTPTPPASRTPSPTPTGIPGTPTATPTAIPATPTATPTSTPTATPTSTPTASPSPTPTVIPCPPTCATNPCVPNPCSGATANCIEGGYDRCGCPTTYTCSGQL